MAEAGAGSPVEVVPVAAPGEALAASEVAALAAEEPEGAGRRGYAIRRKV